jgi:hypothetical protein
VKHLVAASFASALLGAMSGTGLMLWMTRNEAPPPAPAAPPEAKADLVRRLEAVERALATLETPARVVPTALAAAEDEPAGNDPSALDAPVHVDNPVYEAAVLEIIEQADQSRGVQRPAADDDQRRRRSEYWVNELTMRLGLTPAQTDKLLALQSALQSDLERERRAFSEGAFVPREQRRAARQAIRRRAEERLRGALAPRQQVAYEQLDDKLKLYRPKDGD